MPGTPSEMNSCELRQDLQPEDPQNFQRNESAPAIPPVEITQTDRLNKRLLVSFLNRLNSQPTVEQQSKNEEKTDDTSFE